MTQCAVRTQLDDTLRYKLLAQRRLTQENVRVTVEVNALIGTSQLDQAELDRKVRQALAAFIAADWTISTVRRVGEAVGFEKIKLSASTRVPHAEVFNLEDRARRASAEGLSLLNPTMDYSLPANRVTEIVQALRREIVEQVKGQIVEFNALTERNWRLGDIEFGVMNAGSGSRSSKGAYRDSDSSLADMFFEAVDGEEGGITGSERIALIADVTLRAAA